MDSPHRLTIPAVMFLLLGLTGGPAGAVENIGFSGGTGSQQVGRVCINEGASRECISESVAPNPASGETTTAKARGLFNPFPPFTSPAAYDLFSKNASYRALAKTQLVFPMIHLSANN